MSALLFGPSRSEANEPIARTPPQPSAAQAVDPLTPEEHAAGWRLLFDGRTGNGWQAIGDDTFPASGWSTTNGELAIREAGRFEFRAGGDLATRERFTDFILDFEFLLSRGANSGIKYRARPQREWGFVHSLGCEYQLLDDVRHPDARAGHDGNRTLASLYDLLPAKEPKGFLGVETWNRGRIHVEAGTIEHSLNGRTVLSVDLGSPEWRRALAGSKFSSHDDYCEGSGQIVLQDHGDAVRFRNLKILVLDASEGLDVSRSGTRSLVEPAGGS